MDLGGQGGAAELIRGYRREAGLTQRQLADMAGVSIGVVRDLEQGRTAYLQEQSARRLARALRLDRHRAGELAGAARGEARRAAGTRAAARGGSLRIGVLGPLAAWRGGVAVPLGPAPQRAVLALLALHPGTGLPRAAIIDALWGDDPPPTAVTMIQSYISRLRQLLGPVGQPRGQDSPIMAAAAGYRLCDTTCKIDLVAFERLARRARDVRAAGDLAAACARYADALALWRGEPLADLDVLHDHPALTRLNQDWADAVTGYAEAASAAGWHDRALPQLRELTGRDPLNERAHARLMIALAGSGQQAAALAVYDDVRRLLDSQLGVSPGAEMADAHARVLRQDIPAAASVGWAGTGPAAAPRAAAGVVVPRQLPGEVPHFVGRGAELAALTGLLDEGAGRTVVISAIGGTAGVGKTALAVHWAHQTATQFPDGQLYVNLRGYDPGQPMTAADALAGFLRALGVPGPDMPPEEDERAARYRSLLAGRRMLVVLDNAGGAEQVRPLLPGSPACVALVTSRDSLAGLVARDGARRLDLDMLSEQDAVGLLRTLIGARVDADLGAAAALAAWCSRLPLALRVAAELAAARPATPLTDLAAELADQQQRLDLLEASGDPRTAVRAVFSWSYQHLDPDAARLFRLAGLHPGPDLDPYAAAALTSSAVSQAGKLLDQLTGVHLLQVAGPGRYGMHDLLRAYAAEQAAHDGQEAQRAALTRLFDYYLHTAATAMDTMFPAERHRRPRIAPPAAAAPPVTDRVRAQAWLDEQRAALVAVAAYTAGHGWPGHATRLAATLFRYLDSGGYYPEAMTIHTSARYAARRAGDRAAEANALTDLGTLDARMGRCQPATGHHQQALALFRKIGDQPGQARALHNLGTVELLQVRPQQADGYFQQALARYRQVGDRSGEARTLNNLGTVNGFQGHYRQAAEHHRQALALCKEISDRGCEALALTNLGSAYEKLGRYEPARGCQRQALALAQEIGDRTCQAHALVNLGHISVRQARYRQATEHHEQALALFRKIGDRSGQAEALNGLGDILLAASRPGDARTQHAAALDLASQVSDRAQQAHAHNGLARAHFATGDPGRARHHWQEALTRYTELGAPEADEVRAELATAGHQPHITS